MNRLFVTLVALLPAAFAFWSGRRIVALGDDPTLPERLLAHKKRNGVFLVVCALVAAAIGDEHLVWTLPLLVLSRMAVSYWLRKHLYGDTWSITAYFSFFARLILAVYGYWLLLASSPWLVSLSARHEWTAAAILAVILLVWNETYGIVFRAILGSRPVDDPDLVARFREMRTHCNVGAASLEQVDLRGGVFVNAVALPSIRRPAVLLSGSLVERLDHDETTSIVAHELAHLEHFNPRRLRRLNLLSYAFIAAGTLMSPVSRLTVPEAGTMLMSFWPLLLFGSMVFRARRRQAHETASDLRAIALAGNPAALIRALSKIHAFGRWPRRWDTQFERQASHPSLARRIQAIRAADGVALPALGEAATFIAADDLSSVTFSDDRLMWRESPSDEHFIRYPRLTTLRVDARRHGRAYLVAVDTEHRQWELHLRREDVERMQATLDIVDSRLAATGPAPGVMRSVPRVLALVALTFAASAGQLVVVVMAALTAAWPSQTVTSAMALASAAGAVLSWRGQGSLNHGMNWTAVALLACGAGFAFISFANRKERLSPWVSKLVGPLAGIVLVAFSGLAFWIADAVDLHQAASEWPSASVLVLALAGALMMERRRAPRYASAALMVAGFAGLYLGSTAFLERFVTDPFLGPAPGIAVATLEPRIIAEMPVPFEVEALRVSHEGRYIAVSSEDERDRTTIHAGRIGEPLSDFVADDAMFVDEGRLLLFEQFTDASRLRLIDLSHQSDDIWTLRVPIRRGRLSFDRPSQRWSLLGWSAAGDVIHAAGIVGQPVVENHTWKDPAPQNDDVSLIANSNSEVLALEQKVSAKRFSAQRRHTESVIWTVSDRGPAAWITTRFDPRCSRASGFEESAVCSTFDGSTTRFFEINPAARQVNALGSIDGRAVRRGEEVEGWATAWLNGEPALFRMRTRSAFQIATPPGSSVDALAITHTTIGVAFSKERTSIVRLYERSESSVEAREPLK